MLLKKIKLISVVLFSVIIFFLILCEFIKIKIIITSVISVNDGNIIYVTSNKENNILHNAINKSTTISLVQNSNTYKVKIEYDTYDETTSCYLYDFYILNSSEFSSIGNGNCQLQLMKVNIYNFLFNNY